MKSSRLELLCNCRVRGYTDAVNSDPLVPLRPIFERVSRVVAVWLCAGLIYSVVFGSLGLRWGYVILDLVALTAGLWVVHRCWTSTTTTFRLWLFIAAFSIALLMVVGFVIHDRAGVWLDETEYLKTLRHGFIVRRGTLPFNLRWLEPVLAGPLNVFPAKDSDALKACNFAALATTSAELVLLLVRLGVLQKLAIAAPIFLLCSYLGTYSAENRLALDPFNYLLFVLILDAMLAAHYRVLSGLLLLAAFNTEKVIYWVPVILTTILLAGSPPCGLPELRRALVTTLRLSAPTLLYLALLFVYVHGSAVDDTGPFVEQLHRLAITPTWAKIEDPVALITTPQMLWFPFGTLTIYALLSLRSIERRYAAIVLLLPPVLGQVLVAHDAQRMVAYSFIVYIPLACLYLTRALGEMPRALANASLCVFIALPLLLTFLIPLCRLASDRGIGFVHPVLHLQRAIRLGLEASELMSLGAFIWLDLVIFSRRAVREVRADVVT